MMDLQRINVKFFVADSSAVPLTAFINVFNSWIQASDGEYYDIADYSHVHAGPGVLLIAHEANISMDDTANRLGMLYNQKRALHGSNREKLRHVFRLALENCQRIEKEFSFHGQFKFRGDEALFLINDRLVAPSTEEAFHAIKSNLEDLARTMYGGADFTLERESDPRKRFSVLIRTPVAFEITALLKNLEEPGTEVGRRAS